VSLWIKICGNTSLADAQFAVDAGADAVGFVFASSPRRVTPVQVASITPGLPASVEKIGVFVDASFEEIAGAVRLGRLTGVQLHSETGSSLPAQIRAEFGPSLRIVRVVHFGPHAVKQAGILPHDPNTDAVLVDSRTEKAVGGTGISFDWAAASQTLFRDAEERKLIAAGGLNPENVAEAIATLAPWGVDVASGVEAVPGKKDRAKVLAFVANARAAASKPVR
jgi:phosphoribosylanthranilate isomerase